MSNESPNKTRLFAVIAVRSAPTSERAVISYSDEKALLGFLAKPSIVALGYSSREEAETNISRERIPAQPLRYKPMVPRVATGMHDPRDFFSHWLGNNSASLRNTQNTICDLLQRTLAVAIVILYSKNVLSAAVRALISF